MNDQLLFSAFFPTRDFMVNPHDVSLTNDLNELFETYGRLIFDAESQHIPDVPPVPEHYYFSPYCTYKLLQEMEDFVNRCWEEIQKRYPQYSCYSLRADGEDIVDQVEKDGTNDDLNIVLSAVEVDLSINSVTSMNDTVCSYMEKINQSFDLSSILSLASFFEDKRMESDVMGKLADYYYRQVSMIKEVQ